MKTLVIHNILWAHYKAAFFEEIQKQISPSDDFHVLQIARNELSRKSMETTHERFNYNYTLLFDDYIENIPKLKEVIKVITFLVKYNPDVVNVTGYSANVSTLPVIFISKLLGKKVIMSNESTGGEGSRKGVKEWIKRKAIQACSGFVVFGKSSADYVKQLGAKDNQILVDKAAVVNNRAIREAYDAAIEQSLFTEITTTKNFIFVGRISPEKNVDLLVKAFQEVSKTYADWGLIIVGNGSDDGKIKTLISQNPKNIYKYNSVGWREIPKFFTKADCLVLPSNSEPWGLVVNEAMICGLTAIVTNVCGCADDLIKDNGVIIPPNNLESLENALEYIISNPDLPKMKRRSEEIIQEFNVEKVAKNYVKALNNLR